MLLSQDCCGRQHGDLLSSSNGFENGTNRHFSFTEANISTDQTIHGFGPLHISLHIRGGLQLIGGGFIRK